MSDLPTSVYDAAGARALDDVALSSGWLADDELMRRAGREAFRVLGARWPDAGRIVIACGAGNNGGDGYVVAELAARAGLSVRLVALAEPRGEVARRCRASALAAGATLQALAPGWADDADVVVDALLGTGFARAPSGDLEAAIVAINRQPAPVLALDMPSGLDASTGAAPGVAVRADVTCTFIALKLGLFTGEGPELAGTLCCHDLGLPSSVYRAVPAVATRITRHQVQQWLPRRGRCAHKGRQGRVVLVGGAEGMTGALLVAARAAARGGAGLVTAAGLDARIGLLAAHQPELMTLAVDDQQALGGLLDRCQAFGIGPGLGHGAIARALLQTALASDCAGVIDADALHLLAAGEGGPRRLLTPHPGEAARLLGVGVAEVAADRPGAVRCMARAHRCVVLLKGCGTLVSDGDTTYLCDAGNPGMATGGMGDCLTGLATALLGQGMPALAAAASAAWLHATAADLEVADHGMSGLLATDLLPRIRLLMEPGDD